MKKKAILLDNTLSLIIAVAGLLILFFAAYAVFKIANANHDSENARALLDVLVGKINSVEDNSSANFTLQGFDAKTQWYFLGWGKNVKDAPEKCFFKSCLCTCPGTTIAFCQSSGFCRDIDKTEVNVKFYVMVDIPVGAPEAMDSGSTLESTTPYIQIQKNLMKIQVEKTKDALKIEHYTDRYLAEHKQ